MIDIAASFQKFCSEIHLHSDEFMVSLKEITKKLNKKYYETNSEANHLLLVGSIGRGTAVEGVSDIDVIFELPQEVYKRFNAYESNGQSALLQEVKNVIAERFPKTEIKGDGQVVDVFFDAYTVELVPVFRQSNNSFKYPDSNDGGSWKITDPIPEQEACKNQDKVTGGTFVNIANILRTWKNNRGFYLGGLLVDTLAFNFFDEHDDIKAVGFGEYYDLCKQIFLYISKQDPHKSYWLAPGSNQQVYNCEDGAFIGRAKRAFSKLDNAKDDEREDALISLFGHKFSTSIVQKNFSISNSRGLDYYSAPNEQFIEDKFPVDISGRVKIDCQVTQNGFRPFWLSSILPRKINKWLSKNKQLYFRVVGTDIKEPFDVYWKVRNIGNDAKQRRMERGQIYKDDGRRERHEHTDFNGSHYVECYIVKNGICVARSRIQVPINVGYIDKEHLLLNGQE